MTDYTKATGSTGTMMIRDTAGKIQFWLKAGSATFNHSLPYGFTVNGTVDSSNTFDFKSGGAWQMVRQWTVSYSQTVQFRLGDSGTSGLGGPTVFSVWIDRHRIPDAPSAPSASLITASSAYITFSDPADIGGTALDARQIAYRRTVDTTLTNISSDKSTSVTGLSSGTAYYFWARVHNEVGWSNYSPRITVTTLGDPAPPGVVSFSEIKQTSVKVSFVDGATGGTAILERQVGYSLSTGTPTNTVSYSGPTTVTGLLPARKYYFRSRTRNSVGWSDWGPTSSMTTLAGVRINVGGVWKTAIPYVKVAGVWKVARPWGRQFGYWEEAT